MKSRAAFAICFLIGGCAESEPTTSQESRRRNPELSTEPIWTATGPSADGGTCFAAQVALADLDGDGHQDLIVGEPPCVITFVPMPGSLWIYRGIPHGLFADTPVVTPLTWTQTVSRPGANQTLRVGDVDGDGRDDLVVAARAGVQVFAGVTSIAAPLAPTSRLPGTGVFGATHAADFDGDGRIEIVNTRGATTTVWRIEAGAPVAARVFASLGGATALDDWNDDELPELWVGGSGLFTGCAPLAGGCDGALSATPAWSSDAISPVAILPDLDRDGLGEVLANGADGRLLQLYRSDPLTGIEDEPVWMTLGDPNYPSLGARVHVPRDLDGEHRTTDFVAISAGRMYAFFADRHRLSRLEPEYAWPRQNLIQNQILVGEPTYGNSFPAVVSGDLDHDRFSDLVVGIAPEFDEFSQNLNGQVYVYRGGRVPGGRQPAEPFLLEPRSCALPTGDKPDVWVDPDVIARSLHVDRHDFAPDACELVEGCVAAPGERKLLRFAGSIANRGGSPMIIPGPETAPELYVFDECHGHDHLANFARYELTNGSGTTVATGRKQGFFLVDIAQYCEDAPQSTLFFPDQGISPGWADVYVASLPCQWLDITDVPDGTYTLEVEADTNNIVDQDDVMPDLATLRIRITGDRVTVLR